MKKLFAFSVLLLVFTACLNHDILDKDLDGSNFKQGNFYTSGDFNQSFNLTVESTVMNPVTNGTDTLCSPVFTVHLEESFASKLESNWDGEVYVGTTNLTDNLLKSFTIEGEIVDCNASNSLAEASIKLTDPNTQRVTVLYTKDLYLTIVR